MNIAKNQEIVLKIKNSESQNILKKKPICALKLTQFAHK